MVGEQMHISLVHFAYNLSEVIEQCGLFRNNVNLYRTCLQLHIAAAPNQKKRRYTLRAALFKTKNQTNCLFCAVCF
jgi:hypothetical protein